MPAPTQKTYAAMIAQSLQTEMAARGTRYGIVHGQEVVGIGRWKDVWRVVDSDSYKVVSSHDSKEKAQAEANRMNGSADFAAGDRFVIKSGEGMPGKMWHQLIDTKTNLPVSDFVSSDLARQRLEERARRMNEKEASAGGKGEFAAGEGPYGRNV